MKYLLSIYLLFWAFWGDKKDDLDTVFTSKELKSIASNKPSTSI